MSAASPTRSTKLTAGGHPATTTPPAFHDRRATPTAENDGLHWPRRDGVMLSCVLGVRGRDGIASSRCRCR